MKSINDILPDQKIFNRNEVRQLLAEMKKETVESFNKAIQELRNAYPESVFPSNVKTNDCKKAKTVRETCDKIQELWINGNKKNRVEIRVVAVTEYDKQSVAYSPESPYIWSKFNGWKGFIIKEGKNGNKPAYEVEISNNGLSYLRATINKTDVEIL